MHESREPLLFTANGAIDAGSERMPQPCIHFPSFMHATIACPFYNDAQHDIGDFS